MAENDCLDSYWFEFLEVKEETVFLKQLPDSHGSSNILAYRVPEHDDIIQVDSALSIFTEQPMGNLERIRSNPPQVSHQFAYPFHPLMDQGLDKLSVVVVTQ